MQPGQNDTKNKHLGCLDAARGIAALVVMVYHYINWRSWNHFKSILATIIFNGIDAVSFFFVLSGFVLSYKYIVLNEPLDIRKFYLNRVFRLWPAFFITVVFNALNSTRNNLNLHSIANIFLFDKTQFWEEAILIRGHPKYYGPGWTLVLELAFSFFMPFGIALAKKDKNIIFWLLLSFLLIGNNLGTSYMFHIHFTLGVLISCLYSQIAAPSFRQTKWYRLRYPILIAAIFLFSVRHVERIFSFWDTYNYLSNYFGIYFYFYSAIASFVFIVAIIQSTQARNILEHKWLLFIGKISYSIYLMHWLLVTDIYLYWDQLNRLFGNGRLAYFSIFTIYASGTILLATLLHYTIELPFIKLGKRLMKQMKPSLMLH